MTILELFNIIENNLTFDEIKGELTVDESKITWRYNSDMVDDDSEPYYDEYPYYVDGGDNKLFEVYDEDVDIIENIIDDYTTEDSWDISEPEIEDGEIYFHITKK